jgi:alginate O-acetyltransferase complex protein AlgI
MLFNSLHFLIFFPIVTVTYYLLPHRYRWVLLLAASYYFYMVWRPIYALLIVISTLIDYIAAIQMSKTNQFKLKRLYLAISLSSNIGILFVFKYYGFFIDTLNAFTGDNFDAIYLLLPMGISFYTFQTLSYTIDVYRKQREPEYHLGYFALYVTFFPQLVAGPIERSDRLIPQLRKEHKFGYVRTVEGLQRMVWGFFKKVVIADNLALAVNYVYGNVESASGLTLLIATGFFAYQIYCDFSGYSDIAIGSSKILGIDLMENFNRPYFSTSIKEFWSRWHISLSTWFRDYVYIPLGGSKKGAIRTYINILSVFLISGLWHGASWMFVIWGAIHGIFLLYERLTSVYSDYLWRLIRLDATKVQWFIKWCITIGVVLISWVFFRASSFGEATLIFSSFYLDSINGELISDINSLISLNQIGLGIGAVNLTVVFISILFMEIIQIIVEFYPEIAKSFWRNKMFKNLALQLLVIWILLFGNFGFQEFIYFQF